MANSISLAAEYAKALDEAYAAQAATGILNVAPENVRPVGNGGTYQIAKLSAVGLGTYSRATGFPAGNATLTWETMTYSNERGREFNIDRLDDTETLGTAFGRFVPNYIRSYVVPEIDAYRFSKIQTGSGVVTASAALASGGAVSDAVDVAIASCLNYEVPYENLVLFVSATMLNYLKNSTRGARYNPPGASPDARIATWDGIPTIVVPSTRFKTGALTLTAGASGGAGGWTNASGALSLNFVLMDKAAVFADVRTETLRTFAPEVNQSLDGWKIQYRLYHECFVLDNKVKGIYAHNGTS